MSKYKSIPEPRSHVRLTKNSNKEWEDVRCTICMEPPHRASLLICSSHDKGCRPYICNGLYQYDCLKQYHAKSSGNYFSCPLCRGHIIEERVMDRAIPYLDSKVRSCKYETCDFSGTRVELTRHWFEIHRNGPPEEELRRQMEWENLEYQEELQDIDLASDYTAGTSVSPDVSRLASSLMDLAREARDHMPNPIIP